MTEAPEFVPWAKISRMNRDIIVTEKLDGSNSAIHITLDGVFAQSRKRLITPADDNFGFARWVAENEETLVADLGYGLHFGEWWGSGIQRNYGMKQKHFSLFNTYKWQDAEFETPNMHCVPVLHTGPFDTHEVNEIVKELSENPSPAALRAEGNQFYNPEGVVVFLTASQTLMKVTCEGDEKPKGSTE